MSPARKEESPDASEIAARQVPVPRKQAAKKPRDKQAAAPAPTPEPSADKAARKSQTVKTTLYLPQEISEGCRDAVIYLAGHPEYLTLTTLIENALRRELDRLKDRYTDGKPFPTRRRELRAGRPLGT